MAPLVVLMPDQGVGPQVLARPARLRERLAARLVTSSLDRQLARGVSPAARAALSLRAHALGEPAMRLGFVDHLRRVLDDARAYRRPAPSQVPILRHAVLAAAEELEALAARLDAPGPVGARGLAQVRLLLRDGSSPLYWRGAAESLTDAAAAALEALEPSFRW